MTQGNRFVDRRNYMKLAGAASIAGLAGCLEGDDENGEEADGENTIVAGTAPGFPPFEMVEDGELVGFDIDLLEAVVDETEYELAEWEQLEFDSLIPALDNGNIDVIAAAMTISEERQEQIAFSDPYYSSDQSILVQTGGDFQPESLDDFEGQTVGAQSGTTGETVVRDDLIEAGIIDEGDYTSFDNYVLAVEDLESGLIDAVVLDEPVAETFEAERDVEVAFVYETGEEYGFGIRQEDEDLQAALSDGVAAVEESSEYEEITSTWFGE
ncbi:basic amino acid ABC transporter substrate-binding protein [Natranaeroarchaeum aerophilus]|uniref:Basic amino acid ABC transporter substrate-binding protein n=1 Tax=Natranaeroarchaeum aerophilus TaxID=2917711 RepID=A0AAE3K6B5_9EURY|nr:basic amino acid ABC transporter substrate-binding protein [Natranaeroarchaeum aerophilus]MCL9814225.1 basic amino acid ABC transporter substrate-binding protein [Natranaeroarchaeum aerophilus]